MGSRVEELTPKMGRETGVALMKLSLLLCATLAFGSSVAFAQMNAADTPADKGFEAAMMKMTAANKASKMTGDADKDFVMMMMPHHQAAIEMAKVELQYGRDATLKKMATDIVAAQQKEIDEMKAWQAKAPM